MKLSNNLKISTEFEKVIELLLTRPVRQLDHEVIASFVKINQFRPEMIPKLLKIYLNLNGSSDI